MGRARMQVQAWWIPQPVLFSRDQGVPMDCEGRDATRDPRTATKCPPPPPFSLPAPAGSGRVAQAGTGVCNHVSEPARVAATRSSLCILNMQPLIRLCLNCKISIRPATATYSIWGQTRPSSEKQIGAVALAPSSGLLAAPVPLGTQSTFPCASALGPTF